MLQCSRMQLTDRRSVRGPPIGRSGGPRACSSKGVLKEPAPRPMRIFDSFCPTPLYITTLSLPAEATITQTSPKKIPIFQRKRIQNQNSVTSIITDTEILKKQLPHAELSIFGTEITERTRTESDINIGQDIEIQNEEKPKCFRHRFKTKKNIKIKRTEVPKTKTFVKFNIEETVPNVIKKPCRPSSPSTIQIIRVDLVNTKNQ